jgi:hypothetical protein
MTVRRLAAVLTVLITGVALGRAADPIRSTGELTESTSVRHAKLQLRLAELNLQKVREMNKRVPSTYITGMVAQFMADVELAKSQLQLVQQSDEPDCFHRFLALAESDLRLAEARAKQAADANLRAPTMISRNDVERMQLVVQIAQLQLDRGKAVANGTPEAKSQWQFELLSDELRRLRQQTYLLGQNRFPQF